MSIAGEAAARLVCEWSGREADDGNGSGDERRHHARSCLTTTTGRSIFKTTGDGLLAEFPSTVQALRAIGVQERLRGGELQLRIGVHQGDVAVEGDDLLGDGVNVAARLEGLGCNNHDW